jgi:hypothetical protein
MSPAIFKHLELMKHHTHFGSRFGRLPGRWVFAIEVDAAGRRGHDTGRRREAVTPRCGLETARAMEIGSTSLIG